RAMLLSFVYRACDVFTVDTVFSARLYGPQAPSRGRGSGPRARERRQVARPALRSADRTFLAAASARTTRSPALNGGASSCGASCAVSSSTGGCSWREDALAAVGCRGPTGGRV